MAWDDEDDKRETKTRDREEEPELLDFDTRSLVRGADDGIADLASVARQLPARDYERIKSRARQVGELLGGVLDTSPRSQGCKAFYRWEARGKHGASIIEGPTVDLMDALATEWGALIYSVRLIGRHGRRIHLRGRVLDLVGIVAAERDYLFTLEPPPGKFEADRWDNMQMQAAESKAIRGVLEHIIPSWVVEEALDAARKAAAKVRTGNKPLAEAIRRAVALFAEVGVPVATVNKWVGRASPEWNSYDLQALFPIYEQIKAGEVTVAAFTAEAGVLARQREAEEQPLGDLAAQQAEQDRLAGLGLGGASNRPAPKSDPPTSATPTTNTNNGTAAAAGGGGGAPGSPAAAQPSEDPKPTPADPGRDWAILRAALDQAPGKALAKASLETALRKGANLQALRGQRLIAALEFGKSAGVLEVDGSIYRLVAGAAKPAAWVDPGEPSGDLLASELRDLERDLPAAAAKLRAELGVDADADEPLLRRYLVRLRASIP